MVATPTFEPMATIAVGSPTQSIVFSNIPQSYKHLAIQLNSVRVAGPSGNGEGATVLLLNGDSGSNYYYIQFTADQNGSLTTGGTFSRIDTMVSSYEDDVTPSNHDIDIVGYSDSDKHKTVLISGGIATGNQYPRTGLHAYRWLNNNPVTSITMTSSYTNGKFDVGTRISLFGIHGE